MNEPWDRTTPPPLAIDLIAKVEAFSARAYADSVGRMTIGFGSTTMPGGRAVRAGDVITAADGRALLRHQAEAWCLAICRRIPGPLSGSEAAALLSFVHNLGEGALVGSVLAGMVNAGRHDLAQWQFAAWVMAGGQKSLGLMRRRELERRIFAGAGLDEYDAVWRLAQGALEPSYARAFADAGAWRKGSVAPAATKPVPVPARASAPGSPG